jgi:hypothetical protein
MLIPNAENAVVDIRKLRDYCLNPEHDDGKHKARLFSSLLGMTADAAEELRQILLKVIQSHEARLGRQDEFGQRYTLDFTIEWQNRSATLRSGWIIEHDTEIPRLTTCYPL